MKRIILIGCLSGPNFAIRTACGPLKNCFVNSLGRGGGGGAGSGDQATFQMLHILHAASDCVAVKVIP